MKKLSIIIFGIVLGFGFVEPVFAEQVIFYSQTEATADYEIPVTTSAYFSIATTTPATTVFVSSSTPAIIGMWVKTEGTRSTSCRIAIDTREAPALNGVNKMNFVTSSTTAPVNGVENLNYSDFPPDDGEFHFMEYKLGRTTGGVSGQTLTGGTTYGLKFGKFNCDASFHIYTKTNGDQLAGYMVTEGPVEGFSELSESTLTRFVLIDSPEDEEVIASTTPIDFSGYLYINQDDIGDEILTDDWWIEVRIRRDSDNQIQVANIALLDTVLRIDDGSGWIATYNDFSTTSEPFSRNGRYTVNFTLHRHSIFTSITSFFGLESYFNAGVLAKFQTHFVIDELSGYDVAIGAFQESLEDSFASTTLETLTERLDTCNPLGNFSVIDCLAGLFTLDSASAENLLTQFREMIGERAPIGYVTRLVTIMTSETATSSFPMISFTFPAGIGLAGETLQFDFNDILSDSAEIASSTLVSGADGTSNVWDVLMPTIDIILYLVLFMAIVHDVTGVHKHTKK